MRRWLSAWLAAARHVSDRPALWLPGALAWTAGFGWLPLMIAVAQPPSEADLTFFGADLFTSGAWPWNAVALVAGGLALVAVAAGCVALGEAALLARCAGRAPLARDVGRIGVVMLVAAAPAIGVALLTGAMLVVVAPAEFRAPPDAAGPVLRTLGRLAPLVVALFVALLVATAYTAAATRLVLRSDTPGEALGRAPGQLAVHRSAAVAQALATWAVRVIALVLASLLLRVLWTPIGQRLLEGPRIDAGLGLLLVGFVAIWLCLVLAGGALHAWGSSTWTRLLAEGIQPAGPRHDAKERQPNP